MSQDPQSKLLLLRNCTGVSNKYFTLRTTSPLALQSATTLFDNQLVQYLRHLVVGDGAGFGQIQQRIATLPIKDGGLGVYTMSDTSKYCYLASCAQTHHLQHILLQGTSTFESVQSYQQALQVYTQFCGLNSFDFNISTAAPHFMKSLAACYFDVVKKDLPTKYPLSTRDATLWQCNKADHAMDFIKAIPVQGLNQAVGPRQFRAVLSYRLGISLFVEGSLCSCCNRSMDIYGDHALHCASEIGIKFRHDMVHDMAARKEVPMGFLSNTAHAIRPTDLLVYNWDNGRYVCFDVTGASPFTCARTTSFTPGQAVSATVTRKRSKYLDKCLEHGYEFGVLALSTFGELSEDTCVFLRRLKNCLASQDANCKVGGSLFHRIGITI